MVELRKAPPYDPVMDEIRMFMGRPMHYDRQGKPMTMRQWAERLEKPEYKRVAETTIGRYWISTVWLGLDHGHFNPELPIIFESMVFDNGGQEGDRLGPDMWSERYATERMALAGHQRIVQAVQEAVDAGRDYDGYADARDYD